MNNKEMQLRGKTGLDETTSCPISNDPSAYRVPVIFCEPDGNFKVYPVVPIDMATGKAETQKSPTIFAHVDTIANGSTAIRTATAGKRFRLMGVCITLLQGTTAAAACILRILDVARDTGIGVTLCIGAMTAVPNTVVIQAIDMKNGVLMDAAGTVLNVNLSSVLAVGGVSVQVWGTEE